MTPTNYCITQHLHFGFFLIVTCSTCEASPGCTAVPLCTSSAPGVTGFSFFCTLPLALLMGDAARFCPFAPAFWWDSFTALAVFGESGSSSEGRGGKLPSGVGVIGLPSFINSTISSASLLRSPPGRNGLSQPLSVLKQIQNAHFNHHNQVGFRFSRNKRCAKWINLILLCFYGNVPLLCPIGRNKTEPD